MVEKNLARALFTIAVALAFGIGAIRYKLGTFAEAGPGLFPALISAVLLVMGAISLWQSRRSADVPIDFAFRGFAIIAISFCGFALISRFANMTLGIVFMVFTAGLAGPFFSWSRSLKITVALFAIAFFMRRALGLDLPLF